MEVLIVMIVIMEAITVVVIMDHLIMVDNIVIIQVSLILIRIV